MRLADTPVTIYAMPADQPGFYAGHVIAEWRLRGTTYHLTISRPQEPTKTRDHGGSADSRDQELRRRCRHVAVPVSSRVQVPEI